jgi:hypothetical protein
MRVPRSHKALIPNHQNKAQRGKLASVSDATCSVTRSLTEPKNKQKAADFG